MLWYGCALESNGKCVIVSETERRGTRGCGVALAMEAAACVGKGGRDRLAESG